MRNFLFYFILFFSVISNAYVPRLKTIAQKAVKNNGSQAYVIERDLSFFSNSTRINFTEKWWVKSGDVMRVDSSGKNPDGTPWSFSIVYKNGQRVTSTSSGKEKSLELSPYFYEPLFHYRNPNSFVSKLVDLKMAPQWATRIPPVKVGGKSETEFTNEAFVKLSRKLGLITYEIGSSIEKENTAPQLWLEQDSFLIKKAQLDKNISFIDESHREYPGGLNYPLNQTVTWNDQSVQINTTSVKTVSDSDVTKKTSESLNGQTAKLPSEMGIKDFYSRFR